MSHPLNDQSSTGYQVRSEVGKLKTVILHRPGPELSRLTPHNNDSLLFDGIPWVERAQQEHDMFAQALREHDVEVLYIHDLLRTTLEIPAARKAAVDDVLSDIRLGDTLRDRLRGQLGELDTDQLVTTLIAGLSHEEVVRGKGLVYTMTGRHDFIIDPLPNLLFTRDSSVWVGDRVAVTSLAMRARRRETSLTGLIYAHHPRFKSTKTLYGPELEHLEGGDILLLAPGVIAVGVGERTTPAGAERLAERIFDAGLAHTLLAVPITQERATMHLDTVCTMVDVDAMVMYPNIADSLVAYTVNRVDDTTVVSGPSPFLSAAAKAMGIDALRLIDTGLDPVTAEREQWDDGNNTLAIAPRVCVAYERNTNTNRRLSEAGIEVVEIAGSELGSGRGGPRCMSCPVAREEY